ncbi:MAG: CPBP family intramembrane metalloprotease [Draconibacterium sp.]|nr:CPBP family intramembrane metalloprotease [Draconibacterium sp.]
MNHKKWIAELVIIIALVFVLNFSVTFIAVSDFGIITGQFLNLVAFLIFLIWSLYRITSLKKSNLSNLYMLFNTRFSIKELLLIVLIFVVGNLAYSFLIEIDIVRSIKVDVYRHFSLNNQTFEEYRLIILIILVLIIVVGVFTEELFFRGYLFKVQFELYGKYTWIINGISWSIFHIFSNTNFIALLPTAFLYSYVYQQKRNLRITIGAHLIMNLIAGYHLISKFV